jgi:hypothetical protein
MAAVTDTTGHADPTHDATRYEGAVRRRARARAERIRHLEAVTAAFVRTSATTRGRRVVKRAASK